MNHLYKFVVIQSQREEITKLNTQKNAHDIMTTWGYSLQVITVGWSTDKTYTIVTFIDICHVYV